MAIWVSRVFFSIALIGFSVQQFMYGAFRPMVVPFWPHWIAGQVYWAYLSNILMIALAIGIIALKNPRTLLIWFGFAILVIFVVIQLPYRLSADLYNMGNWTNTFKALASAGGAFILANALPQGNANENITVSPFTKQLEKWLPAGKVFFSFFMIFCGVEHFIYTVFVASLVPAWMPWHLFWTYFAGIALIGSGLAIILGIWIRTIATLLGIMLFLWLIMLHIPRAIADPYSGNGNEWSSVFEALAFSGFAFVIAVTPKSKN